MTHSMLLLIIEIIHLSILFLLVTVALILSLLLLGTNLIQLLKQKLVVKLIISSTSHVFLSCSLVLILIFFWFHSLVKHLVGLLLLSSIIELLLELLIWILMTLVVTEVLRL